jgi:PIN domain nuclease of toxin-antitoxin system
MNYLLDTHYLLWAIGNTKKLSKKARNILTNPENRILVSTISFWEVSLKSSLGKLIIDGFSPENLPQLCSKMNFEVINLLAEESSTFHQLKGNHHRDPFDRMLIWQAIFNDYTLLSMDSNIQLYASEGLRIVNA